MKQRVLILLLLILCIKLEAQQRMYHTYESENSTLWIVKWNVTEDSLKYFHKYIIETKDKIGRVKELVFVEKGDWPGREICSLPFIIRYKYPNKHTIIESFYNQDSTKYSALNYFTEPRGIIDCAWPYKVTYTINDSFWITASSSEYFIDSIGMLKVGFNRKEIREAINEFMRDTSGPVSDSMPEYVTGYEFSYSKYDRKFPINHFFLSDSLQQYGFGIADYDDIKKCIANNIKKPIPK